MSELGKSARRKRWILGVALALVVGGLLWMVIKEFAISSPAKKKRAIQEISLLKPPPPPPPPKVAPPPPPKVEVQEKINVPKDQEPDKPADAPPPGPDLAVDAAGGAGSDGFGLVGKKGGSDLIGSGGGGGNRFAWYGALIKDRIQERVQEMTAKDKKLRKADYRIMVNVWVNAAGTVTRAELIDSTNDAELDSALKAALRSLPPLREGAPADMPQPIKLRITAR